MGADRHRAARRRGLAAAPPRPTRVRERGGLPARPGQDGGHAHRRRGAQHRPGGRLLPRRGVHLRRHQDQARASGRAGGAHQRPPLRPQGQRERSAGRRGEQRVRPRQRHERVRGLGTLQPVQPGRRVQSRRPRARAGLDHQRYHAVPARGGRGLGSPPRAPRQLLLRDHRQPHPQLSSLAPELRRHRAAGAGRHHHDLAQGRRGPRHARQRDHRPLGPNPNGRGPRQQHAHLEGVALPDRHRRVRPGRRAQSPLLRLGRCPTTRPSSPRTKNRPGSSMPATSWVAAGSCSTSRPTSRTATPSWWKAVSFSPCSSIRASATTGGAGTRASTTTSTGTTTRTTTRRPDRRAERDEAPRCVAEPRPVG